MQQKSDIIFYISLANLIGLCRLFWGAEFDRDGNDLRRKNHEAGWEV